MKSYFSDADLERVRAAVNDAEGITSGEIVPYVVVASDDYEATSWKGAALGSLVGALGAVVLHRSLGLWGGPIDYWIAAPPFLGAALGYLVTTALPGLKRSLIPDETQEVRVRRRAMAAFLEEEVFRTRERTGILLFVSLFEHRVVVLGDEGINRRVEESDWQEVVDRTVRGIREGRAGDALVEAIEMCGRLLQRRGVERRDDDTDELSDELRTRER